MRSKNIFFNSFFLMSGFSYKDLPEDKGIEIAICGRSNSGKSSILNSLSSNKKLALTSKTPGRTQSINIFTLNPNGSHRIADLPGYGFAKVSKKTQKEWGRLIGLYLKKRDLANVSMEVQDDQKVNEDSFFVVFLYTILPNHQAD